MKDPRFEANAPFSDAEIREIECLIGRELPKDYCEFVKEYGGAFVGGLIDGSEDLPVLTFFVASGENGIVEKLASYPDLRDERVLPIASCELGNLYVLSQENSVYYIDYYGLETSARKVSESFDDFKQRIVLYEE